MKTLVLVRHAKSDWDDANMADVDRPLNPRGQRDAANMAQWLATNCPGADLWLSSAATRTRQTTEIMLQGLPNQRGLVKYTDRLYLASSTAIAAEIKQQSDVHQHMVLVGHNPGIALLAGDLVGDITERHIDMPTATAVVLTLDMPSWAELSASAVQTWQMQTPKLL